MNVFSIALKSLRQRRVASLLTGLSVSLGVALMVAVLVLNGIVSQMFSQTGSGYDLLVGAKGGSLQLVLSTIYHIDRPIENLPWRFYEQLRDNPWVERAIPINIGDTTEEGNFPIVGTTPQYFLVPYAPNHPFRIRGDGLRGTWDAVIGSEVARKNNWDIGSQFKLVHAGEDDHVHDEVFTVKGVLAATGTPNDKTAYVHIDGFLSLDGHDKPLDEAIDREAEFFGVPREFVEEIYREDIAEIREHLAEEAGHDHAGHEHHHHGPLSNLQKEVTSVLLVMKGDDLTRINRTLELQQRLQQGMQAQAVNPVRVMDFLIRALVGNIRLAFLWVTGLIIVVSGIGIFVSIYNSMSERRKEIAIMRALGARRQTVFVIILAESALLCLLGGIAGILLGHGLVFAFAPLIEAKSGLLIDPLAYSPWEFVILPILIGMAILVGMLPALSAYKTDVAESLQG